MPAPLSACLPPHAYPNAQTPVPPPVPVHGYVQRIPLYATPCPVQPSLLCIFGHQAHSHGQGSNGSSEACTVRMAALAGQVKAFSSTHGMQRSALSPRHVVLIPVPAAG